MDILPLLDELQTIARNGLAYAENPFDRERYERLMELASQYYGQALDLPPEEVRGRLSAELGYITPKVGASAAIFNEDGHILVVQRADNGRWGLPGGWMDANETTAETAIREAREETGLEVRVVQLVNVFTRLPDAHAGPHTTVAIIYLCEVTGGALRVSHESLEARYYHINEVPVWHGAHYAYAQAAYGCWQQWQEREADDLSAEPEQNLTGARQLVKIYTDGACRGKPGPGGYAAVLLTGHQREEIAGGFRLTNNTRMELMAAIKGLRRLKEPSPVRLYTDSKIMVNVMETGLAERWRQDGWMRGTTPVTDADLWERLLGARERHEVTFIWIKGHAGNVENQRCDRLSAKAARGPTFAIDVGFESNMVQRLGLAGFGDEEPEAVAEEE